jgi:hypothetical protein
MMGILSFITGILPLATTIFGYYVTGKATKEDIKKQWASMTVGMSRKPNRSAADRLDVIQQQERLNDLKNKENESETKDQKDTKTE